MDREPRASRRTSPLSVPDTFGYDFEGTRRWQIAIGLLLTPAERLQWLEDTVEEMQKLVGRAPKPEPSGRKEDT